MRRSRYSSAVKNAARPEVEQKSDALPLLRGCATRLGPRQGQMVDDRQNRLTEHLGRLPSALAIPISAALGFSREGPLLQVYRFVDAVDFVLRFVVAHGAGVAHRERTPIRLRLPDHPTIQDWMSAGSRLRNAAQGGALLGWEGLPALTAILDAIEKQCRDATQRAGLGELNFSHVFAARPSE